MKFLLALLISIFALNACCSETKETKSLTSKSCKDSCKKDSTLKVVTIDTIRVK